MKTKARETTVNATTRAMAPALVLIAVPYFSKGPGDLRRWRCGRERWRRSPRIIGCTVRRLSRVGRRQSRRRTARETNPRRLRRSLGDWEVVDPAGETDTGIRPDVQAGAESGVGDQILHREVRARIRQGTTTRLATGATLGLHEGQVVGIPVRVLAEEQPAVDHEGFSVPPHVASAAVLQVPDGALERAFVGR